MKQSVRGRLPWMAALISLALIADASLSVAAEPATAPHGAMPIQAQEQRLDKLITRFTAPPGIDPVAWATIYMIAGNETTPERAHNHERGIAAKSVLGRSCAVAGRTGQATDTQSH